MDEYRQTVADEEHLKLLPVCYWVLGSVSAFMALYGLIYVGMGALFAFMPWETLDGASAGETPPAFLGWFLVAMGLAFMLAGGTVATLQILTGFWIRKRKRRVLSLVMAGISCLFVPFGTLIGVFTFMTLLRPSVVALYESQSRADAPLDPPVPDHSPVT